MALIYEADLKKQIREKNMSNCYLFYGSEDYLKQFYTEKICKTFVTDGSETFCLRKYDGKELEYKIKEKLFQKGLYYED